MLRLLLLLQLHGPGDHPGGDSWFGVDKMKHFFMGAFVQSVDHIINIGDLTNFKAVLRRGTAQHREMYHAFHATLKTAQAI